MHAHSERLGTLRHELADMAEAYDTQRLAVDLGVRFAGPEELSKLLAAEAAHHVHIANGMVQDGRQHVFRNRDFVLKDIAHHAIGRQSLELDGVGARARQVHKARQIALGLILAVAQRDQRVHRLLPAELETKWCATSRKRASRASWPCATPSMTRERSCVTRSTRMPPQ
jgi:hypothetical protein